MYILSEDTKQIKIEDIDYKLKEIGRGGNAKVYSITNFSPESVVKVLYKINDDEAKKRFKRELETMQSLQSTDIKVPYLYDHSLSGDKYSYIMRKYEVSYESKNFLELPIDKKIKLIEKLIETVSRLHQNQIFHRDIKSSNIMFCPENGLILCDYGIMFDSEQESITTSHFPGNIKLALMYRNSRFCEQQYKYIPDVYLLGVFIWEVFNSNEKWESEKHESLRYSALDKKHNKIFFNSKGRKKPTYNITKLNELLEKTINTNADTVPKAAELLSLFTNINAVDGKSCVYLDETYTQEILTILKTSNAIEVNGEKVSHSLYAFSGKTKLLITEISNKYPWESEGSSADKNYEAELFKLTKLSNDYLKVEFQMTEVDGNSPIKPGTVFVQINEEVDSVIKAINNEIKDSAP